MKKVLFFMFFLSTFIYCQNAVSVGSKLGGGIIKGNSPSQSSYFVSVFVDVPTPLSDKILPRFSFIYAQNIEKFLPNNSKDYHSFIKGFSVVAVTNQSLNNNFYLEESAGFLALNDRIFNNNSVWDYGVIFSLLAGLNLKKEPAKGFSVGLGIENGFTFANTLVKYFAAYFQFKISL